MLNIQKEKYQNLLKIQSLSFHLSFNTLLRPYLGEYMNFRDWIQCEIQCVFSERQNTMQIIVD